MIETTSFIHSRWEIITFPNIPFRIAISNNSHLHSHWGDVLLDLIKKYLLWLHKEGIKEIFWSLKYEDSKSDVRIKFPIKLWITMQNDLVETDDNSPIFYARRLINIIDWWKTRYRRWPSRLVLNWESKIATHIEIILEKIVRPRSWEVLYKLVTAFPSWDKFAPPEPWDIYRLNKLWISIEEAERFWNNHGLCMWLDLLWASIDSSSIIIPETSKDLVRAILEWSRKI